MYSPKEIIENYQNNAHKKVDLSIIKLILLGVLAGLFIGFASVCTHFTSIATPNAGLNKLLSGMVFPGGLAMVVLMGAELFTGNCLLLIPAISKKITFKKMLRNLGFVFIGNFIGSLLLALFVAYSGLPKTINFEIAITICSTAQSKISMSFTEAFVKGILCNILVCTAVWMSMGGKNSSNKIIALYFPILFFITAGFEHIVANMYYIPAGIITNQVYDLGYSSLTWFNFIMKNLIPVTLGNVFGGFMLSVILHICYNEKKEEQKNE